MKNMRVLYVHCSRGQLGDVIRVSKIYSFLKRKGFKVHEKRIETGRLRALRSDIAGLKHVLLNRQRIDKGKSTVKSPLEVAVNAFFSSIQQQILKEAMEVRPHVILAETSLAGYLSLVSKNDLDIPLITDVHGLIGEESEVKKSRYAQILLNVEEIAFQESDYLLTVSRSMERQICLRREIRADKVLVIPNGADVHPFQARFNLPLNVIYAGNFAVYEKVSDYLEIAKAVGGTSLFCFFLMGDGVQKGEILSRISKENIPMKFMGLRTRKEALRILSEMQVGVVTSTSGLERDVAFPIKVLDYMSCGLPVVAPKIGDWGELVAKRDCGIAIRENIVSDFVKALYELCDIEGWTRKSRNGKKCIEREYSWNLVLEPLCALIENILS